MRKISFVLFAVILCCALTFGMAGAVFAGSPCNPNPNFGQTIDMTGVECAKLTQADIYWDPANPGIPAYAKKAIVPGGYEISGYIWDLNLKPVWEMPPVFSYIYIGNGMGLQITKVMPIFNYGQGVDMTDIKCAKVSQADIFMDPNPSNVGIPAYAQKAIVPGGAIICGYMWDLNFKPVLEIPPVGGYVIIGYGMTLHLAQVVD